MGYVVGFLAFLALLGIAYKLRRTSRSLSEYRDRCGSQLSELISHLQRRHLVLSHLLDQLEPSSTAYPSTSRKSCDRSQRIIKKLDNQKPDPSRLYQLSEIESEVAVLAAELMARFEDYQGELSRGLAGCLDGLKSVTKQISESSTTYNASVITYDVFRNSTSAISRRFHDRADHREIDFNPTPSSDSVNSPPLRSA